MMIHLLVAAAVFAVTQAETPLPLPQPAGPVASIVPLPDVDTPAGGHGDPVDGIVCGPVEMTAVHIHAHLTILDRGRAVTVPARIGITRNRADVPCIYWLHTHDDTGLLHVEAPAGRFMLGNVFHIWGQPLGASVVGDRHGPVFAYVGGRRWKGDPATIPLGAHADIVLEVGRTVPLPVRFAFPPGS
jgi:hypothetical protein